MNNAQDWIEAYKELSALIKTKKNDIKHIDLWYQQIDFESKEYPWGHKSLFMDFNITETQTTGLKVQDCLTEITFYFAYNTLSDTFDRSANQSVALAFGDDMRQLNAILQGTFGANFTALDRKAVFRYNSPNYIVCYGMKYGCIIRDYSAMDDSGTVTTLQTMNVSLVEPTAAPPPTPQPPNINLYEIDL